MLALLDANNVENGEARVSENYPMKQFRKHPEGHSRKARWINLEVLHGEEASERKVEKDLGWRVLWHYFAKRRRTCSCWYVHWHALGVVLGIWAFWRQTASVTALVTAVAQEDLAGYADPERGDGIAEPHP